jgi:hypothetical protein
MDDTPAARLTEMTRALEALENEWLKKHNSPTEKLLLEWAKSVEATIRMLASQLPK